MNNNIEAIIEQLKDLDTSGMVGFYVDCAIEQLEAAKEEAIRQAAASDQTTCLDCEADIPNDGNCWYCENKQN